MIRHIILFNTRAAVTADEINNAFNKFYQLKNKLTGILSIVASECNFQDEKSTEFFSDAVSHGITIDFGDRAALEQFFQSSIALPAKEAVVKIAEGGYEGIIGFDFVANYK